MISLICFIIGHKFRYQNGGATTIYTYYHLSDFCLRCGKRHD